MIGFCKGGCRQPEVKISITLVQYVQNSQMVKFVLDQPRSSYTVCELDFLNVCSCD